MAAGVPAAAVTAVLVGLEEPAAVRSPLLALGIGLVPLAARERLGRAVLTAAAVFAGLSVAFQVSPLSLLPWTGGTWLGEVRTGVEDGLRAFDAVPLPFDPAARPAMHGIVTGAVLVLALVTALAVSLQRPLLASAVAVLGGGWAATIVPDEGALRSGALVLLAALVPPLAFRVRTVRGAALGGVALAAAATVGVGTVAAGAAPGDAHLNWREWDLFDVARDRVGVRYVWDAQYGGIRWPERPTTVLRVRSEQRARYWRASTLDLFAADRWIENLFPITVGPPHRELPADPLLPPIARDRTTWVKQVIQVAALDDDHVIAASEPVRVEGDAIQKVSFLSGGVMRSPRSLTGRERYTVWSYAPRPLPRDLVRSRPVYPAATGRYLRLDRATLPGFGADGRKAAVRRLFTDDRYQAFWSYRPLWDETRRLLRGAASPYEATLAIERWFRSEGGFRYEERPPVDGRVPPLVDFVVRHRSGYCQHYAGTMAIMLRLAGIPARVAVGFTSGDWRDGEWVVSDLDAHAWVEAWFEGYGWLPFDPTPGRGTLSVGYTLASDSADAIAALGRGRLFDITAFDGSTSAGSTTTPAVAEASATSRRAWPLALPLLALVVLGGGLAGGKALRRRLRYATRDPRRLAAAARQELVELLLDQGVPVRVGAGAGELRHAVERGVGVPAGAFTDAFARARYGRPTAAAAAAHDVRRELRAVVAVMRERLGPGRRLRGALSLRSLRERDAVETIPR